MLVSHTHKFIFLKTRKTAGTSVEDYFIPYCQGPGEPIHLHKKTAYETLYGIIGKRGNRGDENEIKFWSHMGAGRLRKELDDETWDSCFKFATIRNPFEKMISMYFFRKHRKQIVFYEPEKERQSFNEWCIENGPPLDRGIYTINGQYILDDVIRVENMGNDMARVCKYLNIPWDKQILGRAKSKIRPSWATAKYMYGLQAREAVGQVYDFEMGFFNYTFPE